MPGDMHIVIGDFFFLDRSPRWYFYIFETSLFVEGIEDNEKELLRLFSFEELFDFSFVHVSIRYHLLSQFKNLPVEYCPMESWIQHECVAHLVFLNCPDDCYPQQGCRGMDFLNPRPVITSCPVCFKQFKHE
jgi:hypothetical protein